MQKEFQNMNLYNKSNCVPAILLNCFKCGTKRRATRRQKKEQCVGVRNLTKVRLENVWNSTANDSHIFLRRCCYSAEDGTKYLQHTNENKTKTNFKITLYQFITG